MLHYVTLGSNDIGRSKLFYDAALQPLGIVCRVAEADKVGYGTPLSQKPRECLLWILKPLLKLPATWANGTMIALTAQSRAAVDAFYVSALSAGGTDEGALALRPYLETFYACDMRDPDGNKRSAVCEKPE